MGVDEGNILVMVLEPYMLTSSSRGVEIQIEL